MADGVVVTVAQHCLPKIDARAPADVHKGALAVGCGARAGRDVGFWQVGGTTSTRRRIGTERSYSLAMPRWFGSCSQQQRTGSGG